MHQSFANEVLKGAFRIKYKNQILIKYKKIAHQYNITFIFFNYTYTYLNLINNFIFV